MKLLLQGLLVALLAAPVGAEIYKCKGPDGKILYTHRADQCPGAKKHELKGRIQTIGSGNATATVSSRPAAASVATSASPGAVDEAAAAATWQKKKADAEAQLALVKERLPYLSKMVYKCNRGAELFAEDEETGVRRSYSCDKVRDEHADYKAREQELEAFLDHGLEDACRRAGCMPGWIR